MENKSLHFLVNGFIACECLFLLAFASNYCVLLLLVAGSCSQNWGELLVLAGCYWQLQNSDFSLADVSGRADGDS